MFPLLIFITVIIAALFLGALLSYPVYLLLSSISDVDFSDAATLSCQISGLAASLLYVKYSDELSYSALGLSTPKKNLAYSTIGAFVSGLTIIILLGTTFFLLGIYGIHTGRDFGFRAILVLLTGALGTGAAVALFEETIFRGALLQGLNKQSSAPLAVLATSLVYAGVHFIHFDTPSDAASAGFQTAPVDFPGVIINIFSIQTLDAFLSLFVLGLFLGLIRIRQGTIFHCIGIHAGLVAGIKVFRYLAEYQPENRFQFLVSSHDYRLGFVATFWLFLAAMVYYFKMRVKGEG